MTEKGQANYIDFVLALGLFLLMLFIFINFNQTQRNSYIVADEALMISDAILSEGIPSNWNESSYYRPGIITNNKLNETRWTTMESLMTTNSTELKKRYSILSNFMIRIGNYTEGTFTPININGTSYISTDSTVNPGNIGSSETNQIDRIERAIAYNGTILIMEVIAWR